MNVLYPVEKTEAQEYIWPLPQYKVKGKHPINAQDHHYKPSIQGRVMQT